MISTADTEWTAKQERLSRASANLTGASAAALATVMAARSKAARRVLPKRVSDRLDSKAVDDARNALTVAGLTTGAVSGRHFANRMRDDVALNRYADKIRAEQADNLAKSMAMDIDEVIAKAWTPATVYRSAAGLSSRRATFRRPGRMLRPKRRY